jgi:hypothetical protein
VDADHWVSCGYGNRRRYPGDERYYHPDFPKEERFCPANVSPYFFNDRDWVCSLEAA